MAEETRALKPVERIKSLAQTDQIKRRFEDMLGKRAPAFISSVISAVSSNQALSECEPMSVFSAAAVAASMDLPINQSLGFAHIVPYQGVAQFQIGWKGFIQLAMRTGQYKTINAAIIYEGQLKDENPFTGEMEFQKEKISDKVIGYLLYFKLLNGFEKYYYMTREEAEAHGKRYSRSFGSDKGRWKNDFDAMALKTVVKMGLSKYGVLSIDMQRAMEVDQAEITPEGEVKGYPDAPEAAPVQQAPASTKPSRLKEAVAKTAPAPEAQPQQQEESPI